MKISIVIGLPASGKTTFVGNLKGLLIDDPKSVNSILGHNSDLVIASPHFCNLKSYNKLIELLNKEYDNPKIINYCFDNDPKQSRINDIKRDRKLKSLALIKQLSTQYDINNYDNPVLLNTYNPMRK